MKKVYEKPMFFADAYQLTSSIAKCAAQIGDPDENPGMPVSPNDSCCAGDNGHKFKGGQLYEHYPNGGNLFNDGSENYNGCNFDWAGTGVITDDFGNTYDDYGWAMFGATADNSNHRPGYKGLAFFS